MTTAPPSESPFALPAGLDASKTWQYDPMHFPRPLPRLSQELLRVVIEEAFGLDAAFSNGYAYTRDFSPPPPTPEVIEKGIGIWDAEFVPRIEAFCQRIRSADYDSLSAEELASQLPALMTEAGQHFRYTMIVVFPFMGPTIGLVEFSNQVLGEEGPLLVASMLQGYANDTSAAGTGLEELKTLAMGLPAVAAALRAGSFDTLPDVEGGPQFLDALQTYLRDYGWRVDDWALMHSPTWAEDPATPLRMIAAFVGGESGTPGASHERASAIRAAAERTVRSRLSGEPLEQLLGMLAVAQPHVAMSEGRARWQLTLAGVMRVPILALGRKLQSAGALADPNDAFFLTTAELIASASAPAPATVALVEQRKRELEYQHSLVPPLFLGAPPDMAALPPEAMAVMTRFFGLGVELSLDAAVINGNAASSGVARGRARVIRELSDSDRLEPGDILVCTLTAPPWTPLFAIAAGVVTDTGGVLSHSAICAREFAIPCVAGTMIGTAVIPDGAFITVDGDRGIVRLET